METFVPRGKIFGPILPQFVLEKRITAGAKIMYALLCNYASTNDHCWPSHATLAEKLSCSISSVKKYLIELVGEKLIDIRREQYRSCVYYLMCPNTLNNKEPKADPVQPKIDRQQPKSDCEQPEIGYLNNLNKQEETEDPPLPPTRSDPPMSFSSRQRPGGGGDSFFHDFEKAWEAYPKKEAMGFARTAWSNLRRNGKLPPLEQLLASIKRFAGSDGWQREDGRFIPQMSNWLKGHRWLDPLSPEEERQAQEREQLQAIQRREEEEAAARKARSERLRPFFEAFAARFKDWNPNISAMACGTWMYLHGKGQAPSPADVPDDNGLDIMAFMNEFQRKCDENAYRAAQTVRDRQASSNNFYLITRDKRSEQPMSCGDIMRSGFLSRLLPQREALCVAV
jgi:hypothetical protein